VGEGRVCGRELSALFSTIDKIKFGKNYIIEVSKLLITTPPTIGMISIDPC
jgi:hypothetical protein